MGSNIDNEVPSKNNKTMFLYGQVKLYSELSKALEQKLEQKNNQVKSLTHDIHQRQAAHEELQEQFDHQTRRIADLEQTCIARSAKVSQLVQVITAKKTSEIQEALLEKSLQVADLTEEKKRHEREIQLLEGELANAKEAAVNLKRDRDKNNKLLLELSDIVRTLNKIAVQYEKVDHDDEDENYTTSSNISMPQNQPLRNVKRKIQAIEQDRQRLVQERDKLRKENESKDSQIAALKARFDPRNDKYEVENMYQESSSPEQQGVHFQNTLDDEERTIEDGSKEVSYEEFARSPDSQEGADYKERHESHSASMSFSSSSSSFSSLDAPPQVVNLEEHKELKRKFDKALDVIEKLRNELSKRMTTNKSQSSFSTGAISLEEELHIAQKEIVSLNHELEITKMAFDNHVCESQNLQRDYEERISELKNAVKNLDSSKKDDLTNLQRELAASKLKYEEALKQNAALKRESEDRIMELTDMHELLKQQYQDLETEGSMNIENMKRRLIDADRQHNQDIAELKQVHQERIESLTREHLKSIQSQQKEFEEIKFEYDTFLEIHLKAEDEAKRGKEEYKGALTRIVELESQLLEVKDTLSRANISHQEATDVFKKENGEAIKRYEDMKSKYNTLVQRHDQAANENNRKYEELKSRYQRAVSEFQQNQEDACSKYKELRQDFDRALVEHGKREQAIIQKYQFLKKENSESLQNNEQKITQLKKQFDGEKTALINRMNKETADKLNSITNKSREELAEAKKESNNKLEELQKESRKKLLHVQTELERILEQVQSETRNQINRLESENKRLSDQKKEGDDMKVLYRELASSYHSALMKIEFLLSQKPGASKNAPPGAGLVDKEETQSPIGGTVMEKIMRFENKNGNVTKKSQIIQIPPTQKTADPTFQRDFNAILQRLGYHIESEKLKTSPDTFEDSISLSTVSISLESILARKSANDVTKKCSKTENEKLLSTKDASVQTCEEAFEHSEVPEPDTKAISYLLKHFTNLISVNNEIKGTYKESNLSVSSEVDIMFLLLHSKNLDKVHYALKGRSKRSIETAMAGQDTMLDISKIQDEERTVNTDESSLSVVEKARLEAQKLKEKDLRHRVNENMADIMCQAREKEYRLLDMQYKNLRAKYDKILNTHLPISSEASVRAFPPEQVVARDDASYQLGLALSTVTSDPNPPIYGIYSDLSKVEILKRKLLGAELKATVSKREMQAYISEVDIARKQREEGFENLRNVLSYLQTLESEHGIQSKYIFCPANELEEMSITEEPSSDFSANPVPQGGGDCPYDHIKDFESTHKSSFTCDSPISLECEEQREHESIHCLPSMVECDATNMKGSISQLEEIGNLVEDSHQQQSVRMPPSQYPIPLQKIDDIQMELRQAKEAAEAARKKQQEREENLRDVIYQYKMLQKEHQTLIMSLEKKEIRVSDDAVASKSGSRLVEIRQKHHQLRKELDHAQESAQEAGEEQTYHRNRLRNVIQEHKNLQNDFMKVLQEKKDLESTLCRDQGRRLHTNKEVVTSSPPSVHSEVNHSIVDSDLTNSENRDHDKMHRDTVGCNEMIKMVEVCKEENPRENVATSGAKVKDRIANFESGLPPPPSNSCNIKATNTSLEEDGQRHKKQKVNTKKQEQKGNDATSGKNNKKKMGLFRGGTRGLIPTLSIAKGSKK